MKYANGETHTLFLGGTPPNVVLMIRSKPITYKEFIQKIKITTKVAAKKTKQEDAKVKALKIAKELDQLIEDGNRLTRKGDERDISDDFRKKLDELAKATEIFTDRDDGQIPVSSQPKFGPLINGFASKMHIEMLTKIGPAGTKVTAESETMNNLLLRKEKVRTFYIAGHLLNNNLHGPGFNWQNLTPLTQRANAEHQRKIESVLKDAVENHGQAFKYEVLVDYGRTLNCQRLKELAAIAKSTKTTKKEKAEGETKEKIIRSERFVPKTIYLQRTRGRLRMVNNLQPGDAIRADESDRH